MIKTNAYNIILLRTTGGMGNQLFQYFFALCLKEKVNAKKIVLSHSARYQHKFKLLEDFKYLLPKRNFWELIFRLRIPMILKRLNFIDKGVLKIGKFYWVDDYFQNKTDFKDFSSLEISNSIKKIRKIIINNKNLHTINKTINHFRLKDFFNDKIKEKEYVIKRIQNLENNSTIISNNDDVFFELEIKNVLKRKNINFIESKYFDVKDVFWEMMKYEKIISNGSTIAFWAGIIGGRELKIELINLKNFYSFLINLKSK